MDEQKALLTRRVGGTLSTRALSGLCAVAIALQIGCFSYLPVQSTAPEPAKEVGIVINDRGRALLGERVGSNVDRIDGKVISRQNGAMVVDVYRVTDLRGNTTTWTGERITIPEDAVLGYRARSFSKFKTLVLIGAMAFAVIATLGKSLNIFGDPANPPTTDPPISS